MEQAQNSQMRTLADVTAMVSAFTCLGLQDEGTEKG